MPLRSLVPVETSPHDIADNHDSHLTYDELLLQYTMPVIFTPMTNSATVQFPPPQMAGMMTDT